MAPIMRIFPGSARGARVAGGIWALVVLGAGIFVAFAQLRWIGITVAIPISAFLAVRPWLMGIVLIPGSVVVKGWYTLRRFDVDDVSEVDLTNCMSLLVGFATGYIPFAGAVRMVKLTTRRHERSRVVYLPGSLGRYNTVLRVVREMRQHVGLPT